MNLEEKEIHGRRVAIYTDPVQQAARVKEYEKNLPPRNTGRDNVLSIISGGSVDLTSKALLVHIVNQPCRIAHIVVRSHGFNNIQAVLHIEIRGDTSQHIHEFPLKEGVTKIEENIVLSEIGSAIIVKVNCEGDYPIGSSAHFSASLRSI